MTNFTTRVLPLRAKKDVPRCAKFAILEGYDENNNYISLMVERHVIDSQPYKKYEIIIKEIID